MLFANYTGISLQKYKKVKEFLDRKGITILYGLTTVSTLQAERSRQLTKELNATVMPSKAGVMLNIQKVMDRITTRLKDVRIDITNCKFVVKPAVNPKSPNLGKKIVA